MSTKLDIIPQEKDDKPPKKKMKHDKDKPWDDESIDHWKVEPFLEEYNKTGMLEETSFAIMFPRYREQYLQQVWPATKSALGKHNIGCELDLRQGTMTVRTTRKTFDPYIIVKARDLVKLLARGVPLPQAVKVLEDDMQCDVVQINSFVRNKERFHRRRQRLIGPKGTTLKALEILTDCYIKVLGNTVCLMGPWKGLKMARKVVEDCMQNIHPVYHVKRLMVRRQLANDPSMVNENWERFLPKFKKKNVQRKKPKKVRDKKEYTPFPPPQQPRKIDLQIESGEYFLSQKDKERKKKQEISEKQQEKVLAKKRQREEAFQPIKENKNVKKRQQTDGQVANDEVEVNNLVDSLKRKRNKGNQDEEEKKEVVVETIDGRQRPKKNKRNKKQKLQ